MQLELNNVVIFIWILRFVWYVYACEVVSGLSGNSIKLLPKSY